MRVPSGQPIRLDFEVRDIDDELVTPGSVSLDLLDALGIVQSLADPIEDDIGLYHSILDSEIEPFGHYAWKFSTTAPGKTVRSGTVDVYDPFAQELLGLNEGKEYLNISLDNTAHDDEIAGFIRTLTPAVEYLAGPVEPRTVRRTVSGDTSIVLPVAPAISITSLSPIRGMVPIDVSLLTIDPEGIVYYTDGITQFPRCPMVITYVAGRRIVHDSISHGAKVILAHLWETQRGRGALNSQNRKPGNDTTVLPGFGFSIPNRAVELLKPMSLRTGLA